MQPKIETSKATEKMLPESPTSERIATTIIDIIHERTGFPKQTLSPELRLLDDLNLDSIKAGDVIATAARKLGALGPIDPASLANATVADVIAAVAQAAGEEASPPPMAPSLPTDRATAEPRTAPSGETAPSEHALSFAASQPPTPPRTTPAMVTSAAASQTAAMPDTATPATNDRIAETIIAIVHERTGFPAESLTMDLRLLDDLNLDSIKAGDIIATAARRLGALGPIDPATLADATISDVVAAVRQAANGAPSTEPNFKEPTFAPSTLPATTPEPNVNMLTGFAPAEPTAASMPAAKPSLDTPAPDGTRKAESNPPLLVESASSDDGVEATIVDIIQERTGFPRDTLTPELRLLDDLNMDSIKAGDIIATAARRLGALGPIDPASLADATIADVVAAVRQAKGGLAPGPATAPDQPMNAAAHDSPHGTGEPTQAPRETSSMPAPAQPGVPTHPAAAASSTAMPSPVAPPHQTLAAAKSVPLRPAMDSEMGDWVRNYKLEFVRHRPSATQQDISRHHFHVLYDPGQEAFVQLLARRFAERSATTSFEAFGDETVLAGERCPEGAPMYVIAILPKQADLTSSARKRLERMILRLRRAVANTNPLSATPLVSGVAFVQFGNGRFGTEGKSNIESCTAAGFARALHLESQALQVRIIDLADQLSHFLATDFITNEVAAEGMFRDAAFDRLGRRYETRHRLMQPAGDVPVPLPLDSNDVVLVTGGARGITAECALAMAAKTGAKFALAGSSPHPSESTGAAAEEIATTIQRFNALPGQCEYFSCDLSDEDAVRQLIVDVEAKLGPITGIVHGAGRNTPKMASVPSGEEVLTEVSPKVIGAANLLEALGDRELRCVVGMTSIIGVTGIPGNAWYAFSNETLDLLLRQYQVQHPNTLVRSVSYSAWSEVGMGAKGNVEAALRRMGVGLISPAEGVARFVHALEHDLEDPQMIVTGALGEIDTWRPSGNDKRATDARFVDELTSHEPGVSVTTRVKLTHAQDPYLLDHVYEGTCLFPAVFGMEAMAQAASYLMPDGSTVVRIQNVELTRPIIVGPEGDVELEIHANAMEMNPNGETVVAVGIRTERTQFQFDHFAAEVVFGNLSVGSREQEVIGDPLDIDPQKDLYTGILFQGPRFQRWGDTYHLEEGKIIFEAMYSNATVQGEEVFGPDIQSNPLLTGDPFFRDVLLQSVQAVIPQKIGLPLSIEKIELFAQAKPDEAQATRRLVTSQLHVIGDEVGKEHVCEVVTRDPFGEIRERITGYRVKVLAIKEEYPAASQLADLGSLDQARFDSQMKEAFGRLDTPPPVMALRRMPHLHELNRQQRHNLETPLMEDTVRKFQEQTGRDNATPTIGWLPSGRPTVLNDSECNISLSHDDDYCLCVATSSSIGCDIAPVTGRVREDWEALLGQQNQPVLDQLIVKGDCLNTAGTRVWAAMESVQKALDAANPVRLTLSKVRGRGVVVLKSDQLPGGDVLTTTVDLHRKPTRIVAVVIPARVGNGSNDTLEAAASAKKSPIPGQVSTSNGHRVPVLTPAKPMESSPMMVPAKPAMPNCSNGSSNEPRLRSDVAAPGETRSIDNVRAEIKWDGPQDQAVFEHRFVVTFKECAMRGKHVQHTQFLGWMGSMRENGLLYLVPDMVIKLSDGKSGMATNWTDIDVVGEAMLGDVIVARLCMESMTNATVSLRCDFAKMLPGDRMERLATVRQATTWVRLDGRNDPVKEPFPKFLFDAFKSMEPRTDREPKSPELPESLGRVKLEQRKLDAIQPHEPVTLWSERFSTCLDDSNIVANIYYSRYFHWQWRTSDLYLFSMAPHLMASMTDLGNVRELVPLSSRIDFVRDAFPFDRIRTELAVTRCTECAATFQFTHYRVHQNEHQEKLSVGTQDVVWVRRTPNGSPVPEPFPLAVRNAMNRTQPTTE